MLLPKRRILLHRNENPHVPEFPVAGAFCPRHGQKCDYTAWAWRWRLPVQRDKLA
jgi:hypothetical protein